MKLALPFVLGVATTALAGTPVQPTGTGSAPQTTGTGTPGNGTAPSNSTAEVVARQIRRDRLARLRIRIPQEDDGFVSDSPDSPDTPDSPDFPQRGGPGLVPSGPPLVLRSESSVTDLPTESSVTILPTESSVTVLPTESSVTVLPTESSVTVLPTESSVTVLPTDSSVTVLPGDPSGTVLPTESSAGGTVLPTDPSGSVLPTGPSGTVLPSDPSGTNPSTLVTETTAVISDPTVLPTEPAGTDPAPTGSLTVDPLARRDGVEDATMTIATAVPDEPVTESVSSAADSSVGTGTLPAPTLAPNGTLPTNGTLPGNGTENGNKTEVVARRRRDRMAKLRIRLPQDDPAAEADDAAAPEEEVPDVQPAGFVGFFKKLFSF
ncbi:hypothetical protein QBC38DRAFT_527185 [Podospora fimiseda]|uniref:Uncharacterized protein n=1 Tax=Podospora fimiseda TaxID=252190 RepID=A0AAN7H478_9PEZI|nr:hypothetical protein QBC38DRAFT_527185 [Podospora fimiseda]